MKKINLIVVGLIGIFCCSCFSAFVVDDQKVSLNSTDKIAEFVLTFNRTPDFYTLMGNGRPVDSFQYYIVDDVSDTFPGILNSSSVIRGDELYLDNKIVIRDIYGFGGSDPMDGGFGPIIDKVDFELDKNVLSFNVNYDALCCSDGSFSYALMLTENGELSDWLYVNEIKAIPAPSAFILASIGISALLIKRYKKI